MFGVVSLMLQENLGQIRCLTKELWDGWESLKKCLDSKVKTYIQYHLTPLLPQCYYINVCWAATFNPSAVM